MQAGFFFLAALHLPLVAGLLTPVSTVPPASLHQQYPLSSPAGESLRINGLSENGWEKLVEAGELQQFGPNERIIEEGTLPESRDVYLFLAGEGAWFLVGGRRVAPWEVGAFAGEASFVSGCFGPRSASLVSTSNVACLRWETTKLRRLLDAEPEIEKPLKNFWLLSMAKKLQGALAVTEREATASSRTDGRSVDYGYRPVAVGLEEANKATPVSAFQLALWNFNREYRALRRSFRYDEFSKSPIVGPLFAFIDRSLEKLVIFPEIRPSAASTAAEYDPAVKALREKLAQLTLSNERIAVRERVRMKATRDYVSKSSRSGLAIAQKIDAASTPWFVMIPYVILCWLLDVWFDGRPIARFYLLETVARMPYFSYLSMYHLYETLGWWTVGHEVRRVHAAEEWNESQHLRIMESLGGDSRWADRFLSRHAAVVYYWILNVTFFVSPQLAYNFSELIESHAVDTYSQFVEENEQILKDLPPPPQAIDYYENDLFMFDEFQTSRPPRSRRPYIQTLFDVFTNIKLDEAEHVKTMVSCEQASDYTVRSPNTVDAYASWAGERDEEGTFLSDSSGLMMDELDTADFLEAE